MAVNTMPKAYKYFIVYGDGELELTTDPKGWQEHSIGFTRSEDFGLNVEVVVPLSFSGAGRLKLKQLYEATGVFTKANIRIEKRNPITWVLETFYTYRLDFKTYKDNLRYVEISGIEDGLLSKFQTYKDTEYEIDLPTTEKQFINYTGASVTKKNLIQCLYGSIQEYEKETIGEDVYFLKGNRAVRTYNENLSFTDPNGEPFQTMTFRCIKSVSFTAKVVLKLKVTADGSLFNPASGVIKIIKHNSSYVQIGSAIATYSPNNTYIESSKRLDIFTVDTTQSFSLAAGDYVSIAYYAESPKSYDNISVDDAFDAYFEISNLSISPYLNKKIEVFSYEWLIEKLLIKIGGSITPTFSFGITQDNFTLMLTATPCIKNMGSVTGDGKLKIKLSDILKSLNCLYKIGIDIDGNVFTINSRNAFYSNVSAGLITANNIVVAHDEKHQYGKITVGYDAEKMANDGDLVYPFNCKKEFEIVDTTIDAEIDLTNPFKADPYDIDKYVYDTLSSETNQDNCEFIIFATTPIISNIDFAASAENTVVLDNSDSQPIQAQVGVSYDIPSSIRRYDSKIKVYASATTPDGFTAIDFTIQVLKNGVLFESFIGVGVPNVLGYTTSEEIQKEDNISIGYIQNYEIAEFTLSTFVYVFSESYFVYSTSKEIGKSLYNDHTVTNHVGDTATLYNIPITPKRILQKHLDYISISNYGNENDIKFVKSDFVSAITSKCDFETASVVENADVSSVTPMFLPCTIECDTVQYYNSDFSSNKYKYIQVKDEKTGKIYEGWINSITFAPTRNKSQKLILQAKTI